jgi:hypothetical protein
MVDVILSTQIEDCLQNVYETNSNLVRPRLNVGDRLQKSLGCDYEIDDFNVYKKLEGYDHESIPYGPVSRALKTVPLGNLKLFQDSKRQENGRTIVPFSKVLESGIGECLERAVLMQLASQDVRRSFLISGLASMDQDKFVSRHAYNVVLSGNQPFLVDVQNPLEVDSDGKVTHPYCAPLEGLDIDSGRFVVPENWEQGRNYFLGN